MFCIVWTLVTCTVSLNIWVAKLETSHVLHRIKNNNYRGGCDHLSVSIVCTVQFKLLYDQTFYSASTNTKPCPGRTINQPSQIHTTFFHEKKSRTTWKSVQKIFSVPIMLWLVEKNRNFVLYFSRIDFFAETDKNRQNNPRAFQCDQIWREREGFGRTGVNSSYRQLTWKSIYFCIKVSSPLLRFMVIQRKPVTLQLVQLVSSFTGLESLIDCQQIYRIGRFWTSQTRHRCGRCSDTFLRQSILHRIP